MHANTTGDQPPIIAEADVTDTKEFICAMSVSGYLLREQPDVKAEVLAHLRRGMAKQMHAEGYAVPRDWETFTVEEGYDAKFDLHRYRLAIRSYRITVRTWAP